MPRPLTKMPSCSNQEFSHEQSDIGLNWSRPRCSVLNIYLKKWLKAANPNLNNKLDKATTTIFAMMMMIRKIYICDDDDNDDNYIE